MQAESSKRAPLNQQNAPKILRLPDNQLPPHNEQAEAVVVGAALGNPDVYYGVAELLNSEDFYIVRHDLIWAAMGSVDEDGKAPIDVLTVADKLREQGELELVGGIAGLTQLMTDANLNFHPDRAESYARIIQRCAVRRRLLRHADDVKTAMLNQREDLEAQLGQIEYDYLIATEQRAAADNSVAAAAEDYYQHAQIEIKALKEGELPHLPTGIVALDKIIGGFFKREVAVLAGGPGDGKTAAVLSIIRNAARMGAGVAYFSQEIPREDVVRRLVAMETGISEQRLKMYQFNNNDDYRLWQKAISTVGSWPLFVIDDMPGLTPTQMKRRLRRLGRRVDLVVVDGLWLMEADASDAKLERRIQLDRIMKSLAVMAKHTFNLPFVVVHQINREGTKRRDSGRGGGDKRPRKQDMAESTGVEQNANVILALYRPPHQQPEIGVIKNRSGAQEQWAVVDFDKARGLYQDIPVRSALEPYEELADED